MLYSMKLYFLYASIIACGFLLTFTVLLFILAEYADRLKANKNINYATDLNNLHTILVVEFFFLSTTQLSDYYIAWPESLTS